MTSNVNGWLAALSALFGLAYGVEGWAVRALLLFVVVDDD